jgi:predicted O-methyltransferase YrrM
MSRPKPLPKRAARMLRLMDRAVTQWTIPVIGVEKGRVLRRLIARHAPTRGIEVGSLFGYSAILIAASMPRGGRLTCIEQNDYLAKFTEYNVAAAGLKGRVRVVVGDALRVLPMLRGPADFLLIDARKEDYLDYLRAVEPRLVKGALVIADNTGMFRRDVKPYLDHVRESGRYESREHDFGFDCMEASVFRG